MRLALSIERYRKVGVTNCTPNVRTNDFLKFAGLMLGAYSLGSYFPTCTIFIAEAIKADTSLILLGTISVVVASVATRE